MTILFIIEVKTLVLINLSYRSPQLEWLPYFEHVIMCLLNTSLFWCPFLDPHLTTYHSNIGVHIIAMLDIATSTLI